jgi:hypothetical protein
MQTFMRGFFLGLSAGNLPKKTLERLADELGLSSKELTTELLKAKTADAEDVTRQLVEEISTLTSKAGAAVGEGAEELLAQAGLATRSDLERIEVRLAAVEKALAKKSSASKKDKKK